MPPVVDTAVRKIQQKRYVRITPFQVGASLSSIADPTSCSISVGGQEHWREGKSLICYDTFEHAAWNGGDEMRVVDFRHLLRLPVLFLNDFVIYCIRSSALVQSGVKRLQQWGERFEAAYHRLSG
jgi:Aspartyl/Asparaginyl beta-hydroxylase